MSNQAHLNRKRAGTPSRCTIAARVHQGYNDVLQGNGFPRDYDTWPAHEQRNYERGRQLVAALRGAELRVPKWTRNARLETVLTKGVGLAAVFDTVRSLQQFFFNTREA